MAELGPFRVNPDGKTLSRNRHSWNNGTCSHHVLVGDGFVVIAKENEVRLRDDDERPGRCHLSEF